MSPNIQAGININSSGTTASVAYQKGNRLWVASAGDSRVILCCKDKDKDQAWRVQALTIDHRPRRPSERARWVPLVPCLLATTLQHFTYQLSLHNAA